MGQNDRNQTAIYTSDNHEAPMCESVPPYSSNNERFNALLNRCNYPNRVFRALQLLVEPGIEQTNYMLQEREIVIGELLSRLDISHSDE